MIVSDLRNHEAVVDFMSALIRKHPDTFQIIISFYFSCPSKDLLGNKEINAKGTSHAFYIDHLIVLGIFSR